jgi:hypothetical protein
MLQRRSMAPSLKYIPPLPLHLPFYIAVSVAPEGFVVASWSRILCQFSKKLVGSKSNLARGFYRTKRKCISWVSPPRWLIKMAFLGILGLLALLSDDQFMMRTSKLLTNGKCYLGLSPPDLARKSESITVLKMLLLINGLPLVQWCLLPAIFHLYPGPDYKFSNIESFCLPVGEIMLLG